MICLGRSVKGAIPWGSDWRRVGGREEPVELNMAAKLGSVTSTPSAE